MSLNYVTVTFAFDNIGGNPAQGFVSIMPTSVVTNSSGQAVIGEMPVTATLDGSGTASVPIVATDNTGLTPGAGFWAYNFTVSLTGQPAYTVAVIVNYASGATQAFTSLPQAAPATAYTAAPGFAMTNPMTTAGDLIDGGSGGAAQRLAIGSAGQFLQVVAGAPAWATPADFAPGGLTGATSASRYVGATTSGSPGSGTFVTGDYVVDRTGKIWICTTGGTPGTWTQAGAALDGTATDIQPDGVQTAGAVGKGADAGHIHPFQPWQFYVKSYGAKGDGQLVTDGAMSSSSNQTHLACATSTPFANAAANMPVHVGGAAGSAYTPLCTTIASVTDSGHVVLNASATSTVASAVVYFGTDDTAAIQSAINAAVAYAQAHHGYAEVLFDPVMYIIGGAPVVGGGTATNAQITLPILSTTAQKVTLVFKGTAEQGALNHWQQTIPQAGGAVLACARNDGTSNGGGANGPSFVVAGPYNGYGAGASLFSNLCPVVDGVGILVPYNGTYGGWGFFGCAEASLPDWSVMTAGVPPASSSVPKMSDYNNITNQWPVGVMMPDVNNNDFCYMGRGSAEGICIGALLSEHAWFDSLQFIYCLVGVQVGTNGSTPMPHSLGGNHLSVELCNSGIVGLGATSFVYIARMDVESVGNHVYDPHNYINGTIGVTYNAAPGVSYGSLSITTQASSVPTFRALDLHQPSGPVTSGLPAAPNSGSAWQNQYWRDAWITLHMSAGSVTALSIDSTSQNIVSGTNLSFLLPSGHTFTPTYSGGTLTYTVTLI